MDERRGTRGDRRGESQPLPTRNNSVDIQSLVIGDVMRRRQLGIERYGTPVQAHNGRNALLDLYEELIDAAVYCKQLLVEQGNPSVSSSDLSGLSSGQEHAANHNGSNFSKNSPG